MKFEDLIYLDNDFISSAFQALKSKQIPTKITKTEDISAGASSIVFKAGVSSKETKEFPFTSLEMYREIETDLDQYPSFTLKEEEMKEYPNLFWTEGFLAIGSTRLERKGELVQEDNHYQIASDESQNSCHLNLVTNNIYFTSGYDQIMSLSKTLTSGLWLNIRSLLRILYYNSATEEAVASPILILKGSNQ